MNFNLVFCKNKKQVNKYFKVNAVKNKVLIDIEKIIDDEDIDDKNIKSQNYFKILVFKKIKNGLLKNKDIFYIPNVNNFDKVGNTHIKLKNNIKAIHPDVKFNLILFFNDFKENMDLNYELMGSVTEYDDCLIIEQ